MESQIQVLFDIFFFIICVETMGASSPHPAPLFDSQCDQTVKFADRASILPTIHTPLKIKLVLDYLFLFYVYEWLSFM